MKSRTTAKVISRFGLSDAMLGQIDRLINHAELPKSENVRSLVNFFIRARSTVEERWIESGGNTHVAHFLGEGNFLFEGYEWQSFKLPSGTYTPDWYLLLPSGRRVYIEIKGSTWQKNFRDAKSKIRAAATLNPFDIFVLVVHDTKGVDEWHMEIVTPDPDYISNLAMNFKEFYPDGLEK